MSEVTNYRRTHPLLHYVLLLFACVGSYLIYLQFVVPQIEVTAQIKRATPNLDEYEPVEPENLHHQWFKDGDWELQPCSVLQTAHGKILFDDFKAEDAKTWLVYPFTMVLERQQAAGASESPSPIVMRCATGARLHFSKPVTGVSGSSFQLQAAQLEGNVELYRRTSAGATGEDMRIETSNIQIDQNQIFTIDDVVFRFGNNSGVGRNLTMKLSHDVAPTALNKDISRINGITNIRLGLLSSMLLKPKRKATANQQRDRLLSHDQSPIEIKSAGPFEFDFTSNLARFIDRVQIRKMDSNGDTLNCDELILQFAGDDSNKVIQLDAATDQEFELENIIAVGSPAVLNARSQNARVTARSLDYNLKNQLIKANDDRQVEITKDNDRFVAKSIEYSITDDRRLGNLTARGPGQIVRRNPNDTFVANFSRSLTINRISEQQHLIQIDGRSQLQLDKQTQMEADRFDLTVWEIPILDHNNRFVRWEYHPEKLEAKNQVHISSEKLIADANVLYAKWLRKPRPFQRQLDPVSVLQPSSKQSLPQYVRSQRPNYQQKAALPMMAQGNTIQVSIEDQRGKSEITDLQISGNVVVKRPQAKNPRLAEFEIRGDVMQMIPVGEKLFEVKVASRSENPARVLSEKLNLYGKQIFLDQARNSVWVNGQGNVEMNSLTQSGSETGSKIAVQFSGGMIFDGKKIYFERDVLANIEQQTTKNLTKTSASGTALSLTLERRIDLTQLDDQNDQVKIIDLKFGQHLPVEKAQFSTAADLEVKRTSPVLIENHKFDAAGNVIEKLVMNSPHARMDQQSGKLVAKGPGWIRLYRPGKNGRGAVGFGFVENSKGPDSLTYIHTNFDDQLVVNSETGELTILGNLRSAYASVRDFQTSFDPDRLSQLPTGAVRLNCDRIDLLRSDNPLSPKPRSEFIASGNAHIHSDTLDSQADRISYRDDTDELTVQGANGKNVVVSFRRNNQSPWDRFSGSKIIYNVRDKTATARNVDNASAVLGRTP